MAFSIPPVQPNFHAVLIHYPLALLSLGLLIEIFSIFWRRSTFRTAGRWMLLLGSLLSIVALTSGIYAMIRMIGGDDSMHWAEHAAQAPLNASQWHGLMRHLGWNIAGVACFMGAVVIWIGGSDTFRRRLHWPLLAVGIVGMACLTIGAWYGGEMVYGQGVAVVMDGRVPGASLAQTRPATTATGDMGDDAAFGTGDTWNDPLQYHLLLAGLTFAMAAAALGLSWRARAEYRAEMSPEVDEDPPVTPDERIIHLLNDDGFDLLPSPAYPPARFWLLTLVLAVATAIAGHEVMGIWRFGELKAFLLSHPRELGHALGGGSIILLSLLLAAATRFARRQGWLLGILSVLLILAVSLQIWLGILLAFDAMNGPIWQFN